MKRFLGIWLALMVFALGLTSCAKNPNSITRESETLPASPETQRSETHREKGVDDDGKATDDDGKEGPFEHAGSEMKKGFKKAGRSIKNAFD